MKRLSTRTITLVSIIICMAMLIGSFLIPASKAEAAGNTYYVAKTGSNSNPGTEASPWLTIQKAANTLQAGDTVYVKAGTYNEIVTPARSGNSTSPITYAAYPGQKPVISPLGLTTYPNGIFGIYNTSYITVDGFEIANSKDFAGVYVYSPTITNINIKNLTIHDTWTSGILVVSSWESITSKINNVTIDGCTIYNTNISGDQEGISLVAVNNFEIKNCVVHDVQGHLNYPNDKEGIDCKVGCTNGSIHNNEVYHAKQGIYLDANNVAASNISIYNNKLHDNYDNGIALGSEGTNQPLTGISIYNNLIYNNYRGISVFNYNFNKNFSLVNNTFYHNGTMSEIFIPEAAQYQQNCIIRNNIIASQSSGSSLIKYASYPTGIAIDHNLFYDASGYSSGNIYGTSYVTNKDPLFVNALSLDFRIQSNSPAVNAGSVTNAPAIDYTGNTRPPNTNCDIGAYECQNSTTTNQAPVLVPIGNKTITAGQTLNFIISATDPDNNPLTYSATNLPSGASFNTATRTFSWATSASQSGTYLNVYFQVSDGSLTAYENITITVSSSSSMNLAPILATIGNKSVNEGQLLSFTVSASDPDGNALTYSASNVPSGATFNAATRAFSWTPSYSQSGTYANVQFQVSDGSLTASENISINVNDVNQANQAPVFAPISNKSVYHGQLLSFTVSATDPDGNALTYSASSLPSGANFNAATRTFSWTPNRRQTGTYTVSFKATDGSLSASKSITITVK